MSYKLRSRGIRILAHDDIGFLEQMKIYYEPENIAIENHTLQSLMNDKIISLFEFSMIADGMVDTYNFHVDLMNKEYKKIYAGLSSEYQKKLNSILDLFDNSFRNYTVGYKLNGEKIITQSYYFYPTILKATRYGLQGITDTEEIQTQIKRFAEYLSDKTLIEDIIDYGNILYKFKGISIHISGDEVGYKLYGRVNLSCLEDYLRKKLHYDIRKN